MIITRAMKWAQRLYYCMNPLAKVPPSYYLQFVRSNLPVTRPHPRSGPHVEMLRYPDGTRDFSKYNEENFLAGQPRYENYDYFHGRVRKEDMGCAALYAFGITSFKKAQQLFPEAPFEEQVSTCLRAAKRLPNYVADLGCGLGSLTALFLACGIRTDAIDPSPIASAKVLDTITRFTQKRADTFKPNLRFQNITLAQYMEQLMNSSDYPDTFCMIESIEHIPEDETMAAVHQMRARGNCMLIVTN